MVAVFTGNGLGLQESSFTQLGLQLSQQPGRDAQAVNLATGNLVLHGIDELLVGMNLPISATRTYNSLGTVAGVGADAWVTGFERHVELIGTLGAVGSTVRLHTGDGDWVEFVRQSSTTYRSTKGGDAYDTLVWSGPAKTWTFTEGTSRNQETYLSQDGQPAAARLDTIRSELNSNASYKIYYSGTRVTEVRLNDSASEALLYTYDGSGRLTSVSTREADVIREQVRYGYDGQGRLSWVEVDLTPADPTGGSDTWDTGDAAANDGHLYRTSYAYDGTSLRIASVSNSDGTSASYTYDGSGRLQTLTRGDETLSFTYDTVNLKTDVQDALGRIWTYTYDGNGQLVHMDAPAEGGVRDRTSYVYTTAGMLSTVETKRGSDLLSRRELAYDFNGNLTSEKDALGNEIVRVYGTRNRLEQETIAGGTTRYVYDSINLGQLRFVIDPNNGVTEYEYHASGDGAGLVSAIRTFTDVTYSGSAIASTIESWTSTRMGGSTLTTLTYDAAGRLSRRVEHGSVHSSGTGQFDDATTVTRYVYDAQGLLRTQVTVRAGNRQSAMGDTAGDRVIDYVYDGMGRLLDVVNRTGNTTFVNGMTDPATLDDQGTLVTSTRYLDSQAKVRIVQDGGAIRMDTRDAAGRIVFSQEWVPSSVGTRETNQYYDDAGQLRARRDAAGGLTYYFYDSRGYLVAEVSPTGSMVEYERDGLGRAVKVIVHDEPISGTGAWLVGSEVVVDDAASVRPEATTAAGVRTSTYVYDDAGRLVQESDGVATTTYEYDTAHRLVRTTRSAPGETSRVSRTFYDLAGRMEGELDAAGYLTKYEYDDAGRLERTRRYALPTPMGYRGTGTLAQLTPAQNGADQVERFLYDRLGRQVGHLDAAGYLSVTTYDEVGNQRAVQRYATPWPTAATGNDSLATLIGQVASGGFRATQSNYDTLGRLETELDPQGTVTRYYYDDAGRLVRTESAENTLEVRNRNQLFDGFGQLVGEMGDEGTALLFPSMTQSEKRAIFAQYGVVHSYDLMGRRIESSDALGNKTWYQYDAAGRLTHTVRGVADSNGIPNALGEVTETVYTAFGEVAQTLSYTGWVALGADPTPASVAQALGALSFVASVDSRQQFFYDDRGLLIQRIDAEGGVSVLQYTGFGQLEHETQAAGSANELSRQFSYDARGQLIERVDAPGVAGLERSNAFVYDAFGRRIAETDGRGVQTQYGYDKLGRLVDQRKVVQGRTEASTITYDAWSRTLTEVNAIGQSTEYQYNDAARTITITTPEGITVVRSHNRHGDVVALTAGDGETTEYHYDAEGRLVQTVDPLGHQQDNEYDVRGLMIRTTNAEGTVVEYSYDSLGRVLTRVEDVNGLDLTTTYAYDGQGRQVETTGPDGLVTLTQYDREGRKVEVARDPAGLNLRTQYVWDEAGRQLSVTDGFGTSAASTVVYGYDALGQRISETVPMQGAGPDLVTTYRYDKAGNLILRTDAAGHATRYVYDEANRLSFVIDPMGGVTRSWYDEAGRLVATRRYAAPVALSPMDRIILDESEGLQGLTMMLSRVVANDDVDAIQYRVLDRNGRLSFTLTHVGAGKFTHEELVYDDAGRVTHRHAYPDAISVSATIRNNLFQSGEQSASVVLTLWSQIRSLRNSQTSKSSTTYSIYDAAAREIYRVTRLTSSTAHAVRMEYDAEGRLIASVSYAKTVAYDTTPTAAELDAQLAGEGPAARRETRMIYDAVGRLRFTVDNQGAVVERRYDAAGRVAQLRHYPVTVSGVTFDEASLASAVAGQANVRITAYAYDAAGRLASTTDAAGELESYIYDAAGNRTRLTDKLGHQWNYAYDAAGRLVEERSPPVEVFRYVGTSLVSSTAEVITRYQHDGLGNVVSRTENADTAESRTTAYEYDGLGRQVRTIFPDAWRVDESTGSLVASGVQPDIVVAYDALGRAIVQKDVLGNYSYKVYDSAGRVAFDIDAEGYVTAYEYDAIGRQTKLTRLAARLSFGGLSGWTEGMPISLAQAEQASVENSALDRVLTTSYDMRGLRTVVEQSLLSFTRADGSIAFGKPKTELQYDNYGQLVREAVLLESGAAAGDVWATSHHYYDVMGRRTFSVDAEGYATAWQYDALGQETSRTEYARALDPVAVTVGPPPAPPVAGDAVIGLDRTTTSTYDAMGRKLSERTFRTVIGLAGVNHSRHVIQGFEYDAAGRVVATTVTQENLAGAVTQTQRTETDYDALGRTVAVTEPERVSLRNDWNVLLQNGSIQLDSVAALYETVSPYTTIAYDAFGKAVRTVRYARADAGAGTPPPDANDQTSYTRYDRQGRAVIHTDATGHRVYTDYDAADRIVHTWYDLTQGSLAGGSNLVVRVHANYGYDTLGRRVSSETSRTGSAGNDASQYLDYNAFGEVTREAATLADLASEGDRRDYSYDQAGNLVASNAEGGDRSYRYNLAGQQVAEVRQWHDGSLAHDVVTRQLLDKLGRSVGSVLPTATTDATATHTISRTLDRWGNVLEQVDALGHVVTWTYNEQNLATSQLAPLVTAIDANNTPVALRPKTEWVYDALGRLIASRDANGHIDSFEYDAVGNLIRNTDSMGAITRYAYDLLGRERVKQDALGYMTTRGYDQMDRVRAVGDFRKVEPANGLRYHSMRETYLLNGQGDRIEVTDALNFKKRFDYDSRSLLVRSQSAMGVTTHYAYDASGNLSSESNGLGDSRTWTYDVHGRVIAQKDFGDNTRQIGYQANGQRSTESNSLYASSGTWRSVEYYANGLIRRIDEGGDKYTIYEYDANGNRTREEMHGQFLDDAGSAYFIVNTVVYDSNGRISRVTSDKMNVANPTTGERTLMVDYQYDAVGNRRKVTAYSSFGPVLNGNPPVATNALPDKDILAGDENADWQWTASDYFEEVDGDALTYTLTLADGSAVPAWLNFSFDPATQLWTFDVTDQSVVGTYALKITALDVDGSASLTFTLNVAQPRADGPTVINPIPDQQYNEGEALTLDVSSVFGDPDNDPLEYAATIEKDGQSLPLSTIGLSLDPSTGLFSGNILTGLADGAYTVRVTASDGAPPPAVDEFVLTVNRAPTPRSGPAAITVTNGTSFDRTVAGFDDPDNDTLTYSVVSSFPASYGWTLTVSTANDGSIRLRGTPPVGFDSVQLVIEATDPDGLGATRTVTITGSDAPNQPPVRDLTLPDRTGKEGQTLTAQLPVGAFRDPDGDTLTYSAAILTPTGPVALSSIGLGINSTTGEISGSIAGAALNDSYTIVVYASDEGPTPADGTFTLTVQRKPLGPPDYNVDIKPGVAFNHQVTAFTDPDQALGSHPLTYSIVSPSGGSWPSWLTWNAGTRTLSGTPPTGMSTNLDITIRATDPTGLTDEIVVSLVPDLGIVQILELPDLVAALDRPMDDVWPKVFDDTNSDSLTFEGFVRQMPYIDNNGVEVPEQWVPLNNIGLTLQSFSGNGERFRIVGTPHPLNPPNSSLQRVNFGLMVVASDGDGNSISAVSLVKLRHAPVLQTTQLVASAGQEIGEIVYFSDADTNDVLTYTAVGALPPGLTLNSSTGALTGPGLPVGSYQFQVKATDQSLISTTATVTLLVQNDAPVAGSVETQYAFRTQAWNFSAAGVFTDANGDSLTLSATGLPPGVTFNPSTKSFSGTPTTAGTYTIALTANDGNGGITTKNFTVVVLQPGVNYAPVVAHTIPGLSAWPNENWTFTVPTNTFVDPNGDSMSYSASNMPSGMSFNSFTRTFSFLTPSTINGVIYTITLTATDAHGLSTSTTVELTVSADEGVPPWEGPGSGGGGQMAMMTWGSTEDPPSTDDPGDGGDTGGVEEKAGEAAITTDWARSQVAWYTYDAENRVKVSNGENVGGLVQTRLAGTTSASSYESFYDLVGRETRQDIRTEGGLAKHHTHYSERGERITQISDPLGGFLGTHVEHDYDEAGRLVRSTTHYPAGQKFKYYDGEGNLVNWPVAGVIERRVDFVYDNDGRLLEQKTYGRQANQNPPPVQNPQSGDAPEWLKYLIDNDGLGGEGNPDTATLTLLTTVSYAGSGASLGYDAAGRVSGYTYEKFTGEWDVTSPQYSPQQNTPFKHTYAYQYEDRDAYLEKSVTGTSTNPNYRATTTSSEYDKDGRRIQIIDLTPIDGDDLESRRQFAYNADGQAILRRDHWKDSGEWRQGQDESASWNLPNILWPEMSNAAWNALTDKQRYDFYIDRDNLRYTYVNGSQVAMQNEAGRLDAVSGLTAFSNASAGRGGVTVQAGDTLRTLARRIYGNEAYWYVLADANGLEESSPLVAGSTLTVPEVRTSLNDANTFKPYNPAEVTGPTTPSLPYIPPPDQGCGAVGQVIMVAVMIIVTVYTAGALTGAVAAANSTFGTVMSAGMGALGSNAGVAAVAGFAGSAVGQAAGSAMGVASFSWRSAVSTGLASAATVGLGNLSTVGEVVGKFSGSTFAKGAVGAVAGGLVNQATQRLVGVDTSFSWKAIAISAVSGGIGASVGAPLADKFGANLGTETGQTIADLISGASAGLVSSHLRRKAGLGDGVNNAAVFADAFGTALANRMTGQHALAASVERERLELSTAVEGQVGNLVGAVVQYAHDRGMDISGPLTDEQFQESMRAYMDSLGGGLNTAGTTDSNSIQARLQDGFGQNGLAESALEGYPTVAQQLDFGMRIALDPVAKAKIGFGMLVGVIGSVADDIQAVGSMAASVIKAQADFYGVAALTAKHQMVGLSASEQRLYQVALGRTVTRVNALSYIANNVGSVIADGVGAEWDEIKSDYRMVRQSVADQRYVDSGIGMGRLTYKAGMLLLGIGAGVKTATSLVRAGVRTFDDLLVQISARTRRQAGGAALEARLVPELERIKSEGHAVDRHGGAVTDDQLIVRARTGVAPDLSRTRGGFTPDSTAFYSDADLVRADLFLRQNYLDDAIANSPAGQLQLHVSGDMGAAVGRGYLPVGRKVGLEGPLLKVDEISKVKGWYFYDPALRTWKTETIYPLARP